jgi:glycosyltransferase involved in cell wall biosynthesis
MKILLLTAYYKEEARSIPTSYKLARLFAENGDEVVVLTSKAISRKTYETHRNIKVCETKDLFIKDPLNLNVMPNLFGALSKILKKENPDVCIISKYIFFPIIAVPYLKLKKKKVVVVTDTYPGVVWFTRSRIVNFLAKMHYHIVGRLFLKKSDLVVLTHEELVSPTENLGIRKYKIIHNGISLEKMMSIKPDPTIKKRKGEVIITFIGRLASIKGIDTLLLAANKIIKNHKNVRFLIIGEGDKEKFAQLTRGNKQVQFLGYRKEVASVLKKSDIFVMPSISEGLPSAVIEAMACGVPVIASDIPGGMNILVKDKETGLRFRKGDSDDLARKIKILLDDRLLRARLSRDGFAWIKAKFDDKRCYSAWKDVLGRLKEGKL